MEWRSRRNLHLLSAPALGSLPLYSSACRYCDVLPFDSNRIHLGGGASAADATASSSGGAAAAAAPPQSAAAGKCADYINASPLCSSPGSGEQWSYIAAQVGGLSGVRVVSGLFQVQEIYLMLLRWAVWTASCRAAVEARAGFGGGWACWPSRSYTPRHIMATAAACLEHTREACWHMRTATKPRTCVCTTGPYEAHTRGLLADGVRAALRRCGHADQPECVSLPLLLLPPLPLLLRIVLAWLQAAARLQLDTCLKRLGAMAGTGVALLKTNPIPPTNLPTHQPT